MSKNEKKLKFSIEILIMKLFKPATNVQLCRKPESVTYQTIMFLKLQTLTLLKMFSCDTFRFKSSNFACTFQAKNLNIL